MIRLQNKLNLDRLRQNLKYRIGNGESNLRIKYVKDMPSRIFAIQKLINENTVNWSVLPIHYALSSMICVPLFPWINLHVSLLHSRALILLHKIQLSLFLWS